MYSVTIEKEGTTMNRLSKPLLGVTLAVVFCFSSTPAAGSEDPAEVTLALDVVSVNCGRAQVNVLLSNEWPVAGLSFGIADVAGGATPIGFAPTPIWNGCEPEYLVVDPAAESDGEPPWRLECDPRVTTGIIVAMIGHFRGPDQGMIPAGEDHVLGTVVYEPDPVVEPGSVTELVFTHCLRTQGGPPVETVVCDSSRGVYPATFGAALVLGGPCTFLRGDCNGDGVCDMADPIFLMQFLFNEGKAPTCADASDANDDGIVDISDAMFLYAWISTGTTPPPAPFPACGVDPTDDDLTCEASPGC
jgi:hypothetical protein